MSYPPSKEAKRKRSCEESSSGVSTPRYPKQRKLEEHFSQNDNCAQENGGFHFFPAAGRQLLLSEAKKKGKRLKLKNLFESATQTFRQFYELIASSYDDGDDDHVEEESIARSEFDAIPSCSKAIQAANAEHEVYKKSLESIIPIVHGTAPIERGCSDQPVMNHKKSVNSVESVTSPTCSVRTTSRRFSFVPSGNSKCGSLGSAPLNSFDNEIASSSVPVESKKFIGRVNEDGVNDVVGLNSNGISAVHDSNMPCLSAEEENKGLADYKQLLDQVLPHAIYGGLGEDSKGQSFARRTRTDKQSAASVLVARNGIHTNKKSLAHVPTFVIDDAEVSDSVDKDNGISAAHDLNMPCLSAQEENKGLADYKQLLDQVLPHVMYGALGYDTKGQSFARRTRTDIQSAASISVARNVFHTNKKSLAHLLTFVIDDTVASNIVDKDEEKPQVLPTRARIKQQEKQTSLGLGNVYGEKIKETDLNLAKPGDTVPRYSKVSPLFDDFWLQNSKGNRQELSRDNSVAEIKQISNVVVGLVNAHRAGKFKIKEHLSRLSPADFDMRAIDDFEEEFAELTQEHLALINAAISGPSNQVLVSKFNMNISRLDIRTLCDNNWLNDKIIDFYMNLLIERSERKSQSSDLPSVYAMSTFFASRLMSSGYNAVRRWTNKVDIFSKDILLIPINLAQVHWSLAIINFKERTIKYYDSMGYSNPQVLTALEQYLKHESLDKRKQWFETNCFAIESVMDGPRQINGNDCGVVCCTVAEYVTRNKKITFSGQHMKYFRKKMILEIIQRELMQ
uniref:Ubiquitin-like protease family profile domain-containing protein n=1 Tax=Glossina austeni TaxID=7395 RepID=A0A1A9VNA9_GLOAU